MQTHIEAKQAEITKPVDNTEEAHTERLEGAIAPVND